MSGICGVFYLDGRAASVFDVDHMVESIAHRGPHGRSTWIDESMGLGHTSLNVTPESMYERQPVVSASGHHVITADLRIDNRDELWTALGNAGRAPSDIGDAQIVLAAYQKWGEACVQRLLGDFAFAIWDSSRQTLFCARDHAGVKPFVYHHAPRRLFAFGSEIKALFCLEDVPQIVNETRVGDHLTAEFNDPEITYFENIYRLPPAHCMTVNADGIKIRRYWELNATSELRLGSDEEYAEAFRELFKDAVNKRLRSSAPVGSLLSGGLDSSSVTSVARNLMAERGESSIQTFSAVFGQSSQSDESEYINAVVQQGGIVPNYFQGDEVGPMAHLDRMLWHLDEPLYGYNLFINWELASAASSQGVGVLLDGFDGDTTVSHGTGYMRELASRHKWISLASELNGLGKHFGFSPWSSYRQYLWHYGVRPIVPGPIKSVVSATRNRSDRNDEPAGVPAWSAGLNLDFVGRIGLADRRRELRRPNSLTEREDHYNTINWGVMPYTLEILDRVTAAFSIEPRYPFWDRRLLEFCLSVPPDQKISRGWTRLIMRRAMEGILPPQIQWRPGKANLGHNFNRALFEFERDRIEDVVRDQSGDIGRYVDLNALNAAYGKFASEAASDEDVHTIWRSVSLAKWLTRMECGTIVQNSRR